MSTSERFQAFRMQYLVRVPSADFRQISAAWRAHERGEELPLPLSLPSTKLPVTIVPGKKKNSPTSSPIGTKLPVIVAERKRSPSPVKKQCGDVKLSSAELLKVVQQQITELLENRRPKMVVAYSGAKLENGLVIVCEKDGQGYKLERYYIGIGLDDKTSKYKLIITKQVNILTPVDVEAIILTYLGPGLKSKDVYVNQSLAVATLNNRPGCGIDERFTLLRVMLLDDLNTILDGQTDALKWLGSGEVTLLREDTRARLMLYLWVKLAHEPEKQGERDITDSRDAFKRIYGTQLRGAI